MKDRITPRTFLLACLVLVLIHPLLAEEANVDKRPLNHQDYASWKRIAAEQISPDGKWVLFKETPNQADGELVVINVASGEAIRHALGFSARSPRGRRGGGGSSDAVFSRDNRHVVFLIQPSQEEAEAAETDKKLQPSTALGILTLATGQVEVIERVKGFKLPKESGGWVAFLRNPKKEDEKKKKGSNEGEAKPGAEKSDDDKGEKRKKIAEGAPLVVRSLADGSESEFAGARDYFFADDGRDVFFTVGNKKDPTRNGVYRVEPGGKARALIQGEGNFTKLAINKNQSRIVFLSDQAVYSSDQPLYELYAFDRSQDQAGVLASHRSTAGFPADMAISDKTGLVLTEDGASVLFGLRDREIELSEALPSKPDPKSKGAKFDLWHWEDPYPQPQQLILAGRYRDQTYESVYHIDTGKFVQLADAEIPDVQLHPSGKTAFASNSEPYTKMISYDGRYADIVAIDPKTGERRMAARQMRGNARISPAGKYLYWFTDRDWFAWDLAGNQLHNLTEGWPVEMTSHDWDRPSPPSSYGNAGWTSDDRSFLIYDRYDVWEAFPGGSQPRMITEGRGRATEVTYRFLDLDPDEEAFGPNDDLLLSALHEDTMEGGFAWDRISGNQHPADFARGLSSYSRPVKARDADVFLFSKSSFDTYPDLWVSGPKMSNPRKLTDLGSQMDGFLWGQADLRDFLSSDGLPLKGILIKPENFDPNRKYPLMVYIYETLHNGFHRFVHPAPGSSINASYYVSNDYVVWMPDIEYGTGYPGKDALKCVLPGIQMLVNEGFIDSDAIGIQGHSWGGYQIAYMITQTNIFKAVESGAPVSNMTSAYGGIRWQSGMVRQFQYERTQSRLGASLWEVPMRYIENSPIFWADKVETPVLMLHNDEDGAVPWYQGIEFMMALRRLGKEAYMFNYNGAGHGLRKWVNTMDYTQRMAEFFDYHLRGAEQPDWMKSGIKAWEKASDRPN